MDPKCSPKGALEASKRPLGAESCFRMLFGVMLDPLKSSKMELKFDQTSPRHSESTIFRGSGGPRMSPKWIQNKKKGVQITKMAQDGAHEWLPSMIVHPFGDFLGPPGEAKNHQKSYNFQNCVSWMPRNIFMFHQRDKLSMSCLNPNPANGTYQNTCRVSKSIFDVNMSKWERLFENPPLG